MFQISMVIYMKNKKVEGPVEFFLPLAFNRIMLVC